MNRIRLRDVVFLVLGAAIVVSVQGIGGEVQVEAGQCRFGVERDGIFYQANQHTDNYLRPACASIAFADGFKSYPGFGYRAWFLKTGSLQARGNIATSDEDAHTTGTCDQTTGAHCHWRFDGAGDVKGVGASLTMQVPIIDRWSVIGEAGIFFFKSSFSVTITPTDTATAVRRGEEHGSWTDMPAPMAGLTLRNDRPLGLPFSAYFAVRKYWPAEHHALNLTNFGHTDAVLGISKEF